MSQTFSNTKNLPKNNISGAGRRCNEAEKSEPPPSQRHNLVNLRHLRAESSFNLLNHFEGELYVQKLGRNPHSWGCEEAQLNQNSKLKICIQGLYLWIKPPFFTIKKRENSYISHSNWPKVQIFEYAIKLLTFSWLD